MRLGEGDDMNVFAVVAGSLGLILLVRIIVTTVQAAVNTVDTVTSWKESLSHS